MKQKTLNQVMEAFKTAGAMLNQASASDENAIPYARVVNEQLGNIASILQQIPVEDAEESETTTESETET